MLITPFIFGSDRRKKQKKKVNGKKTPGVPAVLFCKIIVKIIKLKKNILTAHNKLKRNKRYLTIDIPHPNPILNVFYPFYIFVTKIK